MKQLLFLLLFPCLAMAQYQGNANQKITLGEQTTADGLVWRGRLADTANLLTNKLDTSVYIVLDTGTRAMWYYRASTTPKWTRLVDSLNNLQGQLSLTTKVTGVLPVENGGTNRTTMPSNYILFGDGNGIDTSNQLFWDITNNRLGVGTNNPIYKLDVQGSSNTVNMRMASNTANDILLYFTGNITGDINMFQSAFDATGSVKAQFVNQNTATGSAFLNIQVPNASTGDPYLQFTTSGSSNYSFGIDNSDADKFKFHSAATPSNSAIAIYTLTTDGKFGIQTESPSEVLHVVGNARISGLANAANPVNVQVDVNGVLIRTSSIDIKEDVQNLPYGLNEVMLLQPSKFSYIDKYKYGEGYDIGFIAQDVNNVIPEAVGTGIESDIFMDSVKLIPVLTKAIQEQQALIKALEQRILNLENK